MLTTNEFLRAVLPPNGRYCLVGISKTGRVKQVFTEDMEVLEHGAQRLAQAGEDAYFATATFTQESRKTFHARELAAFFLDLDCGADPDKHYPDQASAVRALKEFINTTGLPRPMLVNSGYGVHVYWPLTHPIPAREWGSLAKQLKQLCEDHKFHTDRNVTADAARILRLPGSINFKHGSERPVYVWRDAEASDPQVFRELLAPPEDPLAVLGDAALRFSGRPKDPTTERLAANFKTRFKLILARSVEGTGCAQILHAFKQQHDLPEPMWRAALSVAQVCDDREKAIHAMSHLYPDYNPQEALAKAAKTKGPYTCKAFAAIHPEGCEGCALSITSPVQLGKEFIEPDDGDVVVNEAGDVVSLQAAQDTAKVEPVYAIPPYPAPYVRGQYGGVYLRAKDESGEPFIEMVAPYDLYVVNRINDPDSGEMVLMRLHLPKDGVREFLVPLATVVAKDKLRDTLATYGVPTIGKRQDWIMVYLTRWVEELQTRERAQQARKQFGWTEGLESFVIGDREIFETYVKYSPPSNTTLPLIPHYAPRGSLATWSEVVSHYATPGLEQKAFTLFLGFGNLLLGMTSIQGYWLSLHSPSSGSGKTTALRAVASIYGAPRPLMLRDEDTDNMFWNRVGVHQHLPVILDEVTNMDPERTSRKVYGITEGRGKGRLQAHSNVERNNHTQWCTGVMSSSNESIRDKLTKNKLMPDGELMRMLEFYIPEDHSMTAEKADGFFRQLDSNYGHAVVPFVQYVIANLGEVKRRVESARVRLSERVNMAGPERFWVAMGAVALVGGEIANELDLVNIPTAPIEEFFIEHLNKTRAGNRQLRAEVSDFLGDFLQRRVREMLIINGNKDQRTGLEAAAIQEPLSGLSVRFEPDTGMLFVSVKEFKNECHRHQYSYDDSLNKYRSSGALLGIWRKRIAAGSKFNTGVAVPVLAFDTTKIQSFDPEALRHAQAAEPGTTDSVE